MNITWIGQSGYILRDENTTIYLDPYLSDCVNRIAGRERMIPAPILPKDIEADAFICTHNHLDHLDIDLIADMDTANIDFYAPSDCAESLHRLGVKRYSLFDCGEVKQIGNFKIEAVYANHTIPAIGIIIS